MPVPSARRRSSLVGFVAVVAVVIGVPWLVWWLRGGGPPSARRGVEVQQTQSERPTHRELPHLGERSTGMLSTPVQDASVASLGAGHALLLGGLSAADVS